MRATRIEIRNIMATRELVIEPGAITRVTGGNEAGKTSVLEAIRSLFGGGHDATLLRRGETEGEIVLVIEDGTEFRKRVTAEGSRLTAKAPTGKVAQPKALLETLCDGIAFNPIRFWQGRPEQRVEALLDVLPIEISRRELKEAAPFGKFIGADVLRGPLALAQIDKASSEIYQERTVSNRLAKEKRGYADETYRTIPEEPSEDPDVAGLRKYRDELLQELATREKSAMATRQTTVAEADKDAEISQIVAGKELDRVIAEASLRFEEQKRRIQTEQFERVDAARQTYEWKMATEQTADREALGGVEKEIAAAEEVAKRNAHERTIRGMAERADDEARRIEEDATEMSRQIEALRELRIRLLSALPIPGAEVRDGEVYLDGIPFARLNLAKQVRLALDVARIRARDLPLVLVDDAEHLDATSMAAFEDAAREYGLQLVLAEVRERDPKEGVTVEIVA